MRTQFGGPIGMLFDPAQQRQVTVALAGDCEYLPADASRPQAQLDAEVQAQMLEGVRQVLGPRMAAGQMQAADLMGGKVVPMMGDFIAKSGLAARGIQVGNLNVRFTFDGQPAQPRPAVPAAGTAAGPANPPPTLVSAMSPARAGASPRGANAGSAVTTSPDVQAAPAKKKSLLVWVIVGVFVLVAGGVGGYFALHGGSKAHDTSGKTDGKSGHTSKK